MNLVPKSPRIGRSPKLKAKWLSNTLAYQYGNNGAKKNAEILVLSNDLDQYLQDIFQSIDSRGKGKITADEFRLLCGVLYLKDANLHKDLGAEITFKEFHEKLCEHFACYGDYTGFLVNQNFRTMNATRNGRSENGEVNKDITKRTEFHKKLVNSKHKCIHDSELFRNWDKLRISGFRLSEIKENIDQLLYEVTFHREESQSLKEIIEDLRTMLQASDAQNIGLQVALRKHQQQLTNGSNGHADYLGSKYNRYSLQLEGETNLCYKPMKGEEKSLQILSRELNQLRELRDKEVRELINFNNQLQYDVTDLSREICRLEDENRKLECQLDVIVQTYHCCRELFAVCVESFKEVERANGDAGGGLASPGGVGIGPDLASPGSTPTRTPQLHRHFSFSGAIMTSSTNSTNSANGLVETIDTNGTSDVTDSEVPTETEAAAADETCAPEVTLIKRLKLEIETQREAYASKLKEACRLEKEVEVCRRHLATTNFQVEALETECSRLLALEDQLVSVVNLLQKGRSQCLSRKTLGQLLLDVIDTSFGEDKTEMTADQFIRMLQQSLSECPLFLFSS